VKEVNADLLKTLAPTVFRGDYWKRGGGPECSDGWLSILVDLVIKLELRNAKRLPQDQLEATQIKEKFGSLRFYVANGTPIDREDIKNAETKSMDTCEDCGCQGKRYSDGWIRVLCDPCIIVWKERRRHEGRN